MFRALSNVTPYVNVRQVQPVPQQASVAEDFDRFKRGDVVFTCTLECARTALGTSDRKRIHEKQQWRELAVSVTRAGYLNDLAYFYLGEAAKGMKLLEAAKQYYGRALDAAKAEKTCPGGFVRHV